MGKYKVYLCDSEDVGNVSAWNLRKTDNKVGAITKAELIDMVSIHQDNIVKASKNKFSKQKLASFKNDEQTNPSGNSWSAQLQRKNFPSRWITYRGNRVLIKLNADGTATVVFSANPSMEHLRVIPKTHKEYEKIKREQPKLQEKRRVKETVTEEEVKQAKERKKQKKEETKEVKTGYRETIASIIGKDRDEKITEEDVAGVEKKLEKKAERLLEREEEKQRRAEAREAMKDLIEVAEGVGDKIKEKIDKAIEEVAEKTIAEGVLQETGYVDDGIETKTGDEGIDKKLDLVRAKIDYQDAIDILNAREKKKEAIKEVKEKYKDKLDIPKGNVEITSLQGVVSVDWDKPIEASEEIAIESALKSIESRNRASMNTELYKALEDREGTKSAQREMAKGAKDTLNAMAGQYLEGASLSNEIIEKIGVKNASRLIAGAIAEKGGLTKKVKELEDFIGKRSQDVTAEIVGSVKERLDRVERYRGQGETGMLAPTTAGARVAQQMGTIGRELGLAVGSMEAAATVLDSMRDEKQAKGDIIVNMGKNIATIQDDMKNFGLSEDDYFTKKADSGGYEVTIKHESFDKMLSESTFTNQRDATVEAIKTGKAIEGKIINEKMGLRDWKPDGVADTFTDWKTKPKEGYTAYQNKKGAKGYTSEFPEGTTLYGKELPTGSMDSQQKAIKFAASQKRVVWNLGAGTGKTFAYLGTISHLKEAGKLDSFSVVAPPSRLREEFLKDTEKFFPHLKVAILDKANGMDAKLQMMKDAQDGKYDVLITGHDSVKSKLSNKDKQPIIARKTQQKLDEWKQANPDADARKTNKKEREFRSDAVQDLENYGLPQLLAEHKPSMVAVDEAHEVFKSHTQKDSLKFAAIKKLQEGTPYVINGTGTVVKNNMGELGNLLHITNPSEFTSASAFSKKYKEVNQGSTMFQSQAAEAMAREYDNTMITEHLALKPDLKETKNDVKLTESQQKDYAESERQYRLDRDGTGYGVIDTKTGNFVMEGKDLKKFEDVGFEPSKDPSKMSPKEKSFIKELGFTPHSKDADGHKIVTLGRRGAAQRRDNRHENNINGGDFKSNAKLIKMSENIKGAKEGSSHLIFYNRHQHRDSLKGMLKNLGVSENEISHIHGKMTSKDRKNSVTEFMTQDGKKFVLSTEAGMTGLNMQKADNIHWLSRPSTYAKQLQGNARTYRTGRGEDVNAHYYDSDTVVDDAKMDRINKKKRTTEAIQEVRAKNLASMKKKKSIKKGLYIKF